jgi:hypothetical protein
MSKYIMRFDGMEYRFLSNFYPSVITLDHLYLDNSITEPRSYATLEHAYQATKTFNMDEREEIRTAKDAYAAKRLGKILELRSDWEAIKDEVMLDLLRRKFSDEHPELKEKLIATGEDHLVEGNTWHDNHFGVCVCISCGSIGKNMLGELLMKVRSEL